MGSSSVECLICHFCYESLAKHLRTHDIYMYEYLKQFPGAETVSDNLSRRFSESLERARQEDSSIIQRISTALLGHEVTVEARRKIGAASAIAMKGNKNAEGHTYSPTDESNIQRSESAKRAHEEDPTLGPRKSAALTKLYEENPAIALGISAKMKENWKDQAFVTYMTANWNKHPNGSEERLGEVLEKYFPGIFKFVGNSSEAYIGGRLTDFIDRVDKKIAIEMFGLRWHDCSLHPKRPSKEELTAHYASYGFKCLVFWEDVVWCDEDLIVEVVDRLLECGRLADFEDPTVTLKSRVWRLTHNAAYNKKRREKRRQVRKYLRLHPEIVAEYEARLQLEAQD